MGLLVTSAQLWQCSCLTGLCWFPVNSCKGGCNISFHFMHFFIDFLLKVKDIVTVCNNNYLRIHLSVVLL